MILVDTNVWSLAYRRRQNPRAASDVRIVDHLNAIVTTGDAVMIGPIRQELLSGVKLASQFTFLQGILDAFPLLELRASTYDLAADCFNRCRMRGIAADQIDMIVCAAAIEYRFPIFTLDADFVRYVTATQIILHEPPNLPK